MPVLAFFARAGPFAITGVVTDDLANVSGPQGMWAEETCINREVWGDGRSRARQLSQSKGLMPIQYIIVRTLRLAQYVPLGTLGRL